MWDSTRVSGYLQPRAGQRLRRPLTRPDPTETLEEFLRFTHQDLAAMDREELLRELRRARFVLDTHPRPHWWWTGRLEAVKEALRRLPRSSEGSRAPRGAQRRGAKVEVEL